MQQGHATLIEEVQKLTNGNARRLKNAHMEDNEIELDFVEVEPFAGGGQGSVHKAEFGGETVCLKKFLLVGAERSPRDKIYLPNGRPRRLDDARGDAITPKTQIIWAKDIAIGMAYLHKEGRRGDVEGAALAGAAQPSRAASAGGLALERARPTRGRPRAAPRGAARRRCRSGAASSSADARLSGGRWRLAAGGAGPGERREAHAGARRPRRVREPGEDGRRIGAEATAAARRAGGRGRGGDRRPRSVER
ncbi:protein kinase [Aureococcus anophagefferens]|nr:protein kinase [Aureococcus anophagefferens]